MITIRVAKKNDLGKLADLRFLAQKHSALFDKEAVISEKTKKVLLELTERELQDPGIIFLLAEEGNEPIGLAIFSLSPEIDKIAFLGELFVKEEYRGQKIGEKMIEEATKIVQKKQLKGLKVTVARQNLLAQKFYRKLGFSLKKREYLLFEKKL